MTGPAWTAWAGGSLGATGPLARATTPVDELLELLERPAWQADALCREYPAVNFFPERGESAEPAKAVCERCLVRPECLAWALEHGQGPGLSGGHGVWAGTSANERRRLRPGFALEVARTAAAMKEERRRRIDEQRDALTEAWLEEPNRSARATARAVGASLKLTLTVRRALEETGELEPSTPAA